VYGCVIFDYAVSWENKGKVCLEVGEYDVMEVGEGKRMLKRKGLVEFSSTK